MTEPPHSARLADAAAGLATAYVHVPFCARRCPYCDFAVVAGRPEMHERYAAAVAAEIEAAPPLRPLAAIHFGGGTPTQVDPDLAGNIVAALGRRFGIEPAAQLAVEANPDDLDEERCLRLGALGFGRIVVGAQSFDDAVLRYLGRTHQPEDIARAVAAARRGGFSSIALDLVFGSPVEDDASWQATVEFALELYPDHVSCYELTVEPGTKLGDRIGAGDPGPDPDDVAVKYRAADRMLESAGLIRYEVTSWARPGHQSRYGLASLSGADRLGFGIGAESVRDRRRSRNVDGVEEYLQLIEEGRPATTAPATTDGEPERLLLGLRRRAGVAAGDSGMAVWESAPGRRLAAAGKLRLEEGRLVVGDPLQTDAVAREVLAVIQGEC